MAVIILNPVEQLKRSRDARRIADLDSLESALDFFFQEMPNATTGPANACDGQSTPRFYVSVPSDNGETTPASTTLPSGWDYVRVTKANAGKVNGTGWLPIPFTNLPSGSPLSNLPLDPSNRFDQNLYYGYSCKADGFSYTLTAFMESKQYNIGGEKDRTSADGGPDPWIYEVGPNKFLSPLRPVLSYGFDENAGTTAGDTSDKNNAGTLTNGPLWADGKIRKALDFDGTDDFVAPASQPPIASGFTIAVWVKPDVTGASRPIFMNDQVLLETLATDKFKLRLTKSDDTNADAISGTLAAANTWSFVVGTWNGTTTIEIYVNEGGREDFNNSATSLTATTTGVRIGRSLDGTNRWDGILDEFRIYPRALSEDEIKHMYNSTK